MGRKLVYSCHGDLNPLSLYLPGDDSHAGKTAWAAKVVYVIMMDDNMIQNDLG